MAGLHDRILRTLKEAGPRGLSVEALKKRLHPLLPSAIAGAVTRMHGQGKLEELPGGKFAPAREPKPRSPELPPASQSKSSSRKKSHAAFDGEIVSEKKRSKLSIRSKPNPEDSDTSSKRGSRRSESRSDTRSGKDSRSSRDSWEGPKIQGRLSTHRDGFGFVSPVGTELTKDVFIPPGYLGGAFSGDLVEVVLAEQPDRPDGRMKGSVLSVLERSRTHLAGFLE